MSKVCKQCSSKFEIRKEDLELYKRISPKYGILEPFLCPDCRQQRRLSHRNERKFYSRKSDMSGKQIVSLYSQDKPYKVYGFDEWWGDDWDPKEYGRDFDFSRSFFEQYEELCREVPRPPVVHMGSENSLYTNHSVYNKNCYMTINTGYSEGLLYCSNYNLYNKNCVDCLAIQHCELCYYCVDSKRCNASFYLHECETCSDCVFGYDLQGCNNCFACWNLRHKKFCIFNEQCSESEYKKKMEELMPKTWEEYMKFFEKFWKKVSEEAVFKAEKIEKCINCTGDHLRDCKNVHDSYYLFESEDCNYCYDSGEIKDCIDTLEPFKGELQYESHGCNLGYNLIVASKCYEDNNIMYCQYCWYSSNLLGCFGMRHAEYCVFNKQYKKVEYEDLASKIIKHMQKTGEWGQFFPEKYSPFGYNETAANDYYPLSRDEVLKRGWKWRDEKDMVKSEVKGEDIVVCEVTGKPFKVVLQEKKFYKRMNLPVPKRHPDQRFMDRMKLRNPRHLWERECSKCGVGVLTTYSNERREKIYCEECYLGEVY